MQGSLLSRPEEIPKQLAKGTQTGCGGCWAGRGLATAFACDAAETYGAGFGSTPQSARFPGRLPVGSVP